MLVKIIGVTTKSTYWSKNRFQHWHWLKSNQVKIDVN